MKWREIPVPQGYQRDWVNGPAQVAEDRPEDDQFWWQQQDEELQRQEEELCQK